MVAVDTNVVVRLLVIDDVIQHQKSYTLFAQEQILLIDTVLLETEWVLRKCYDLPKLEIVHLFRRLLGLPNVTIANPAVMKNALAWAEGGLDFADALHLAKNFDNTVFLTFDKKFIKNSQNIVETQVKLL